jgi:Cu+-exporting ATPase
MDMSGKVVAVSGTTSTAAMISCCAHYLTNILPVVGAAGVVALVAQYQIELFWFGLACNAAGILYMTTRVVNFSRDHAPR